jgi:hypothetical protein
MLVYKDVLLMGEFFPVLTFILPCKETLFPYQENDALLPEKQKYPSWLLWMVLLHSLII